MSNKYIVFIVAVTLSILLGISKAGAQEAELKAKLDRDSILIGDHVTLSLTITKDKLQQLGFPVFRDTIFTGVELVKDLPIDTLSEEGGKLTLEKKYIITSFDSARYVFTFPCVIQKGNSVDTLTSNELMLYVNTIPIDTATYVMADIKGVMQYPYTFREFLPWILLGIGVLLLIFLGIYLWLKYRKKESLFFKPKKVDPPYIVAVRELKKLKDEKIWQQEKPKVYYTRLNDIFRVYVEDGFSMQTMEKTSQEILSELEQSELAKKYSLQKLSTFLEVSDLAKFAKYQPTMAENEDSFLIVSEFVEATKPEVLPESKEEPVEGEKGEPTPEEGKQPEQQA